MTDRLPERFVAPGDDDYLEAAWRLKERIRRTDGSLAQGRNFFARQYSRSGDHLVLGEQPDRVAGFAVVRPDGYLSMLGVAPEHRRRGLGTRLVGSAAADHPEVTCHTRVTNDAAVGFYTDLGFVVRQQVEGYYRDGTDAYELVLSAETSALVERLDDILQ